MKSPNYQSPLNLQLFPKKYSEIHCHNHNQQSLTFDKTTLIDQNLKLIKIKSEAYPSIEDTQIPYYVEELDATNSSTNKKKKILKPQVKSEIHKKILQNNFLIQNHDQPIKIRKFQHSDLEELRKLQDQWFPIRYSNEFYDKILNQQAFCFVAETSIKIKKKDQKKYNLKQEKILIGAVVFEYANSSGYTYKSWMKVILNWFASSEDSFYIMTLGVIDEFRKKGVGKMLIEVVMDKAQTQKNIQLVYLHVISYNNAAIKFYEKIGFTNLQSLNNFYHIGGKQFSGQAYGKFLNGGKSNSKWGFRLTKLWR